MGVVAVVADLKMGFRSVINNLLLIQDHLTGSD